VAYPESHGRIRRGEPAADALRALVDDRALRSSVPAREMAELFLTRAVSQRDITGALLTVSEESAINDASRVDFAREAGSPLPLDGLPMVIKDNIDMDGLPSRCGSPFFRDRIATRDATVVRRLRAAGAVVIGKAQATEMMLSLTAHESYPACRNPWDLDRAPGGSSSGSASAVADDETIGALGTDTGGSVRTPSAFCGITGLRPSFGVISNAGVFPVASSMDTVGPMARSAEDVAAIFEAIVGFDKEDSRADPLLRVRSAWPGPFRIGVPEDFFLVDCDPDVAARFDLALHALKSLGHSIVPISIPGAEAAWRGFNDLVVAEAIAMHGERFALHPELFSAPVRARLTRGAALTGGDVAALLGRSYEWKQELATVFDDVQVIATPTTKVTAPLLLDAKRGGLPDATRYAYPWSFGHLPAISLPSGFASNGMPTGIQLAGPSGSDRLLMQLGIHFQTATDWHTRRPGPTTDQPTTEGLHHAVR
jgi:aspartyl-tRNA(Asn)/glutamyl-tRNA(Gln) amidotransferase subunit A